MIGHGTLVPAPYVIFIREMKGGQRKTHHIMSFEDEELFEAGQKELVFLVL